MTASGLRAFAIAAWIGVLTTAANTILLLVPTGPELDTFRDVILLVHAPATFAPVAGLALLGFRAAPFAATMAIAATGLEKALELIGQTLLVFPPTEIVGGVAVSDVVAAIWDQLFFVLWTCNTIAGACLAVLALKARLPLAATLSAASAVAAALTLGLLLGPDYVGLYGGGAAAMDFRTGVHELSRRHGDLAHARCGSGVSGPDSMRQIRRRSLLVAAAGLGPAAAARAAVPDNEPVAGTFLAFSVRSVQTSAAWWERFFGFQALSSGGSPSGEIRFALLRRSNDLVELVQRAAAVPAPTLIDRSYQHGPFKGGFVLHDIEAAAAGLKAGGCEFVHDIVQPANGPFRTFAVRDPDGNVVQVFGL